MSEQEIREQIQVVIEARKEAAIAKTICDSLTQNFQTQHILEFEAARVLNQQRDTAEDQLRALTLTTYWETNNKNPAPGVAIRILTKLNYDQAKAFKWAQDHRMALKLDVSTFEKIAKASPPEFVTLREEAQATIATNLEERKEEK